MRAIVNTAPGKLELQDLPVPEPGPGQVRIRTAACGICATDIEMIAGWDRTGFPSIPGHEWAGLVDAAGSGVDAALEGCRCVAENVLADGGEVGFEHPGGYAEAFLTEAANVQVLPESMDLAAAALIEPLAVCVRAMRRLAPRSLDSALVLGDGPIGLTMVALLARAGVRSIAIVGGRSGRLALAAELGASHTLSYHECADVVSAVRERAGDAFPNVIDASGSGQAMWSALELVGAEGKVLVVGDYGHARADFAWNRVLHRELEIIGSNASADAWPEAVRIAGAGDVPLARLVTHRLPATDYEKGMELLRGRCADVVKVVLEW